MDTYFIELIFETKLFLLYDSNWCLMIPKISSPLYFSAFYFTVFNLRVRWQH